MTVGLAAQGVRVALALPATDERANPADALEDIIAAHRTALLELAPHQAERSVREDTGWHMAQLGLLLCHRDAQEQEQRQVQSAARGVGSRERQEESTGPDRLTR